MIRRSAKTTAITLADMNRWYAAEWARSRDIRMIEGTCGYGSAAYAIRLGARSSPRESRVRSPYARGAVVIQIFPNTTVEQLAKLLDDCKSVSDVEVYIRIESIRGKPCGFLVREPRIPIESKVGMVSRQAD